MCKQRMADEVRARVNKIQVEANDLVFSLPDDCDPKFRKSRIDSLRRQAKNIMAGNCLVKRALPQSIIKLLA